MTLARIQSRTSSRTPSPTSSRHALAGRLLPLLGIAAAIAGATELEAQTCHGTPRRGGVAYEYGTRSVGNTQGVNGAWAGRRFAFGGSYRYQDVLPELTGHEVTTRVSMLFGAGPLLVCPGIGLGYERQEWDAGDDTQLTSHTLKGRAGVGFGYETPQYYGVSVIPYLVLQYAYDASAFDYEDPDTESEVTGDTASRGDIEYGLLARWRFLYAGFAGNRSTEASDRPYHVRWMLGVTFPTGGPAPTGRGGAMDTARARRQR